MPVATKHNGGRTQTNLYFEYYTSAMRYLNIAKHGTKYIDKATNITLGPDILDAQGYPTSGSSYALSQVSNDPAVLGASWTMSWNGNGQVDIPGTIQSLGPGTTQISPTRASTGNSGGSVTFLPSSRDFFYGPHSTSAAPNNVRNVKIFLTSEAAREAAGEVFGAKFLQRMAEANFGVIRFLDQQVGNTTSIVKWSDRKPVDYCTWAASEFRNSIYCGATTNVGNAYAVTGNGLDIPASGGPVHGMSVTVKFNATATGDCTFSLNGTTALPMLNIYCGPVSTYDVHLPLINRFATLTYDSDLNVWIKQGGDSEGFDVGLTNVTPMEVLVRLCAETGAHPYFVTPPKSIDPASDFMPSLATYCRDNGPSWMIPRFEGPNELWNTFRGFQGTPYANAKATVYGWGDDFQNWYGKVMSVLGQAIASVYGVAMADVKTQRKYQVICGVQTAMAGGLTVWDPRMTSAKYLLQTPQAPYLASPAYNWVTHVCIANYMTPSAYNQPTEVTLSNAFAGVRFKAAISGGNMTVSAIDTKHAIKGFISGTTLTVTEIIYGKIGIDAPLVGTNDFPIASNTTITGFGTGTGGLGTYTVSQSQTVASQDMSVTAILEVGKTLFGRGFAGGLKLDTGVTITGGSAPNWTISDNTLSLASGSTIYAGTDMTAPASYVDTLASGTSAFNLAGLVSFYSAWAGWAVSYNCKICGYEGGYSPDYITTASDAKNVLRFAGKFVPALKTYAKQNYKNFLLAGGEYPSMYFMAADYPSSVVWAVLEDLEQTPNPPQWDAVVEFNASIGTLTVKI